MMVLITFPTLHLATAVSLWLCLTWFPVVSLLLHKQYILHLRCMESTEMLAVLQQGIAKLTQGRFYVHLKWRLKSLTDLIMQNKPQIHLIVIASIFLKGIFHNMQSDYNSKYFAWVISLPLLKKILTLVTSSSFNQRELKRKIEAWHAYL